ncbi:MAG: class SAM-dependent methyltransferase [Mucilaginibacter sp.]|jgi:SAM-dependent methyltransferase|nr:class SAM-dependent methyltransferase [Mucilaginibacter sp.]
MAWTPTKEISSTNKKNIAFYNEIAANYDAILDQESSNEVVRKRVKEKFISTVKAGRVLDFGGGTGRDLNWLLDNQYKIIFCEPSKQMRQKAIDEHKNNNITFLENDKVDFTNWHIDPPFAIKADAILSNFAVINCIDDIELLFNNLAQIIKPGGHFIALMLNDKYKKNWRGKLREFVRSLVSPKSVVMNIKYKEHEQTVYVYSPKKIKNASAVYFDMRSQEALFQFTLFHLIRK